MGKHKILQNAEIEIRKGLKEYRLKMEDSG
jgi:hypothetical protein